MVFNQFYWLIIIALVGNFLITSWADWLNLKALDPQLPDDFADVYEAAAYAKSQRYTREKTRFGLVASGIDLVLLLIFWQAGGFNWLDFVVRGLGFGPVVNGLIYLGGLFVVKTLLAIPFSLYETFVLEEKYGFNRTTPRTFVLDMAKGVLLAAILGGPLVAALLFFFEWAGGAAWLYGWVLTTAFIVIVQFVAPTWIMPLFNTFTPLADGELRERIMNYARSVGFSLENVFVIDGSKRSSKSNAFFTGFGRHKRIALFDTLIARHSVPELVGILAHEIGHYKKHHIVQGMVISIAHLGVMLYLLSLSLGSQGLFDAFGMSHRSVYGGLVFFGLLLTPLELALSLLMNRLSRKNEFEADRFASQTTGSGEDLVLALKKLSVHNLANLTPHPFYVTLHYSHPPLLARIAAIRRENRGA
ncbi:MAG: M48 family metallopeptidase [Proteobacteria bacterium]|nr:M48 family metallopeptidase [Desulfobulbaceae bacterium]MBU4154029.1 M48 family metallopeptidase [Pseudomonadota bacterium]